MLDCKEFRGSSCLACTRATIRESLTCFSASSALCSASITLCSNSCIFRAKRDGGKRGKATKEINITWKFTSFTQEFSILQIYRSFCAGLQIFGIFWVNWTALIRKKKKPLTFSSLLPYFEFAGTVFSLVSFIIHYTGQGNSPKVLTLSLQFTHHGLSLQETCLQHAILSCFYFS